MSSISRPRKGSLQFYPRKRVSKFLPSVNWKVVSSDSEGLLGFIVYKVGMVTAIVKDSTDKIRSFGKKIAMPATILEVPSMKVYSVRFYKDGRVIKDVVVSNDKELKKKVKVSHTLKDLEKEVPSEFDDIRVVVYSIVKQTSVKKTPDMVEVGISSQNKLEYVKKIIGREISLNNSFKAKIVDVRGLTVGKGNQGPIKRFGLALKFHKSEKGVRRPGSLGPWHPARVTFRAPIAGQIGLFTRVTYNSSVLGSGSITEKDINPEKGWNNYGKIKTNYLIVKGSVQGPSKRQLLVTPSFRPTKKVSKRKYELVEVAI